MCEVCKKSFSQKNNLNLHILVHTGEKAHVCEVCKKSFNQKHTLNKHLLIHTG
ncbi:Zinc finger protein 567, partial [Stegodyphus mimosarum]